MRIGIVEVGSRSVRLMVAQFERDGSFKAAKTGSLMHGVDFRDFDQSKILSLWSAVDRFYQEVKGSQCDRAPSIVPSRESQKPNKNNDIRHINARFARRYNAFRNGTFSPEFLSYEEQAA
jgi:hypothetical protein